MVIRNGCLLCFSPLFFSREPPVMHNLRPRDATLASSNNFMSAIIFPFLVMPTEKMFLFLTFLRFQIYIIRVKMSILSRVLTLYCQAQ